MKQTKNILKQLETQYLNIEYYHTIVEKIEENVLSNPDIAIESCKSLFEGLGKFIILNIDKSLNFNVVDNFKYKRAISKAVELLETRDPEFESDFSKKLLDVLDLIGNIRNDRGDISHGRLAPKPETSDNHFSNFVMVLTDSFASYLLISFSRMSVPKELAYEDNTEFNKWLDNENPIGNLSYSKALFDQDQVAYEEELENYLNDKETATIDV
ncbi:MAG: abortive infection family protein [Saprospiraceae bacterium]|nr:abortive infection family protein [Candidatus Defluviibacterium haderslevense]